MKRRGLKLGVRSTLGDNSAQRDMLLIQYLGIVDPIARRVKAKLPPCFDFDDLQQAGRLGLLQAAATFDPSRGIPFPAFARTRIKGEIWESVGLHNSGSRVSTTRRRRWEEATRPPIGEHETDVEKSGETADRSVDLDAIVERRKQCQTIGDALAQIPRRHGIVIELHYWAEISLAEIGRQKSFGVSTGRVSQIHREAKRMLRKHFMLRGRSGV